jgi:hypothetical protein
VLAERIAQRLRNSAIGGGVKKAPRAFREAAGPADLGDMARPYRRRRMGTYVLAIDDTLGL